MPTLQRIKISEEVLALLEGSRHVRAYLYGDCRILFCEEPDEDGWWYHASVSCESRHPTWEELKEVAALLMPGKDVVQWVQLANEREWVNIHEHCFHLRAPMHGRIGVTPDLIVLAREERAQGGRQ